MLIVDHDEDSREALEFLAGPWSQPFDPDALARALADGCARVAAEARRLQGHW